MIHLVKMEAGVSPLGTAHVLMDGQETDVEKVLQVALSLVPRPCAFVACSTLAIRNFILQVTNAQGLGTRLTTSYIQFHLLLESAS